MLKSVGASGRIITVGNPFSDMLFDRNVCWKVLRNELTVVGSWNSEFSHEGNDDWHYPLDRLEDGRIEPLKMITRRLELDGLEKVQDIMRNKRGSYGKITCVPEYA